MTRNTGFFDFVDDYVKGGFIIATIIMIIVVILGSLIYDEETIKPLKKERYLYEVLEGKAVKDGNARKAANIIKGILTEEYSSQESLDRIDRLSDINNNFYFNLFFNKRGDISKLVSGKVANLSDTINDHRWKSFFRTMGIIAYCVIVIGMTINLIVESYSNMDGILEWPYRRVWPFPVILIMSPALLPCMTATALFKSVCWIVDFFKNFNSEDARNGDVSENARVRDMVSKGTLEKRKKNALETISKINNRLKDTKNSWVDIYTKSFEKKIDVLRDIVVKNKKHLSDCGVNITNAQKNLAESKQELVSWEKNLENKRKEVKADYLRYFDQLANLHHVKTVGIDGNTLKVYTDIIYIDYMSKRYEIGIFLINIDMECNTVTLDNLSNTNPSGRTHPYARHGGLCWGNIGNPLDTALRNKEYASAVQFIITALSSAEGDNPTIVREWREIKKDETKKV